MLSLLSKCLVDKSGQNHSPTHFVDPHGSTFSQRLALIYSKWTTIRDKWTKLDLSNATLSTCGFRNGGQNRFSICPPFTYIYLRKCKSGQKWTLFSYILYFFLLFSLIPPSTCYYVITPFYQNDPFYQRFCYIFTFCIIFVTLSGIKLVLRLSSNTSIKYPRSHA